MAAEPFSIQASVTLPPDDGQPNSILDFSFTGQFTSKMVQRLELAGSGVHSVGFGSIGAPGVKAVFLEYLNNAATGLLPVILKVNGGTDQIEVTPGGCWIYCNPNAVGGITALSITRTAGCTIRVTLLQ